MNVLVTYLKVTYEIKIKFVRYKKCSQFENLSLQFLRQGCYFVRKLLVVNKNYVKQQKG